MTGRFRIRFRKRGELRWLSHLEMNRAWLRILRRASLPVKYSQGFSPHPKMAFSPALAVGMAGAQEYLDIVFDDEVGDEADLVARINDCAPEDMRALAAREIGLDAPSLGASVKFADWRVEAVDGWTDMKGESIRRTIESLTNDRIKDTNETVVENVSLLVDESVGDKRVLVLRLPIEVKVQAVVDSLNLESERTPELVEIERTAQWVITGGELQDPIEACRAVERQ